MASSVALPLEKQFAAIAGLTNINSTSTLGNTNITLQFDLSRNIDAAAQDVQAMIGRASRALPPQMPAPPSYQKSNPSDQSALVLVISSSTLPLSVLDEYGQQTIAQRISMISGVAQVDLFGSQKYAVRIDVDPRQRFFHRILTRLHHLHAHELRIAGLAALGYGTLELVEGVGLWLDQLWAEYLTVIATSLFIPFELYELAIRPSLWKAGGIFVNVLIVLYLARALRRRLTAGKR